MLNTNRDSYYKKNKSQLVSFPPYKNLQWLPLTKDKDSLVSPSDPPT